MLFIYGDQAVVIKCYRRWVEWERQAEGVEWRVNWIGDSLQETWPAWRIKTVKSKNSDLYTASAYHINISFACHDLSDRLPSHWLENTCKLSPTVTDSIHTTPPTLHKPNFRDQHQNTIHCSPSDGMPLAKFRENSFIAMFCIILLSETQSDRKTESISLPPCVAEVQGWDDVVAAAKTLSR